jgi:hypothetical protein
MIKYITRILLLLVIAVNSIASDTVQGEGRFNALPDDSLTFIKSQVIHQAFLDVLTKEITSMGLNSQLFWQKYDKQFQESFDPTIEVLKTKFKIGTDEVTKQDKEKFEKNLRLQKLKSKKKYGTLSRVIQSYGIKRYTRSQQNPNARYVKLDARVNRVLLSKIYYNYVRGKQTSDYGSLFLNIKYNLKNCNYSDLGVEKEKDFTDVVNNHWLKWFSENKPGNIANIEILKEDKLNRLNSYFKLPYEKMISDIPEVFVNSLYFDIEITIEKAGEDEKYNDYKFNFSGGGYLLDLQSNNILASMEFPEESKQYRHLKYEKLSTVLANHVYRMPFNEFSVLKKKIKNIAPMNSIHRISLYDFANMKDIYNFVELIKARGVKNSLNARLESIGTNRAEIVIFMDGEITELKTLLNSLESAKKDLSFDFIDTDNVLGIKFNKLVDPADLNKNV